MFLLCLLSNCILRLSFKSVIRLRQTQGRIQDFGLGGPLAGDLGDGSPQRGPGQSPSGGLGPSPWKPEACNVMRLKKHGEKKNKSIQTDIA